MVKLISDIVAVHVSEMGLLRMLQGFAVLGSSSILNSACSMVWTISAVPCEYSLLLGGSLFVPSMRLMIGIMTALMMNHARSTGVLSLSNICLFDTLVCEFMPFAGAPAARWILEQTSKNGYAIGQILIVSCVWFLIEAVHCVYPTALLGSEEDLVAVAREMVSEAALDSIYVDAGFVETKYDKESTQEKSISELELPLAADEGHGSRIASFRIQRGA